jgi:hypothetical protein
MTNNYDNNPDAAEAAHHNTVEIQGRPAYKIAWLRLDEGGMINLYAPPLAYPVLRLFPTQRGMLHNVGIDPQEVGVEPFYANFFALYSINSRKLNARGNPYKDVVDLVPVSAAIPDPQQELLSQILEEVRDIRDYLYERVNPTRSQRPLAVSSLPATADNPETGHGTSERQAPARAPVMPKVPNEKDQLVTMLGAKRYVDCLSVLGIEATCERRNNVDGMAQFAGAVRPRIVPATVTDEQLATVCRLIAEDWTADRPWKPMVIALAYYVNETAGGGKKSEVLLKAQGLYLSLA